MNDQALAVRLANVHAEIPDQSWWGSTRDAWQTAISAWCHAPGTPDAVRQWVFRLAFKSRLFRPSTPAAEFDGRVSGEFVRKLGAPQAAFAIYQWQRRRSVEQACAAHGRVLREALMDLGLAAPGAPGATEVAVAPRVSWLVTDRDRVVEYFRASGIDLGQWFDGPLSPLPSAASFNYRPDDYPKANWVARRIVNLPSHSRLDERDLDQIRIVLRALIREHPGCALKALA